MANGSHKPGPARADRLREELSSNKHMRLAAIDEARIRGELPSYSESDSEITANAQGLHAKGIPRFAWWMLGLGIMIFIAAAGVALVVALL